MRYPVVANIIGSFLKYISIVVLLPVIFSFFYKEHIHSTGFIIAALVSILAGFIFAHTKIDEKEIDNIKKSEAFAGVFFSWVLFTLICAIPYLFYNFNFTDALFESASGITTTGATVMTDFSLYPKTLFFYRSMTQWFGGMGIIVLFIAILPKFAVAGRQMFSAEAPVPLEEKITPRIRHTASWLWTIYLGFTIVEIILLKLCGMDIYNAICNSLSTVSTGGFSPNPESIFGYHSTKITVVIFFFIFLAGANFILQYKVFIQGKFKEFFKSEEFLTYTGIVAFFGVTIALILQAGKNGTFLNNLITGLFQTVSILTSAGFASVDFIKWGADAKLLLFATCFIGGCAMSTSGGIKIIRWIFIVKYLRREISKIIHPSAVYPIKLEGRVISNDVIGQLMTFLIFYFVFFAITTFVVALIEKNPTLAISGAISSLANIGPGFENTIGPMGNFSHLHLITKWIFIFNMIIGRLELIPFLALLHKDVWRG